MIRSDRITLKILLFQALKNFFHISMGTEMKVNSHGSKTKPTKAKLYILFFFFSQMQFKLGISKEVNVLVSTLHQLGIITDFKGVIL